MGIQDNYSGDNLQRCLSLVPQFLEEGFLKDFDIEEPVKRLYDCVYKDGEKLAKCLDKCNEKISDLGLNLGNLCDTFERERINLVEANRGMLERTWSSINQVSASAYEWGKITLVVGVVGFVAWKIYRWRNPVEKKIKNVEVQTDLSSVRDELIVFKKQRRKRSKSLIKKGAENRKGVAGVVLTIQKKGKLDRRRKKEKTKQIKKELKINFETFEKEKKKVVIKQKKDGVKKGFQMFVKGLNKKNVKPKEKKIIDMREKNKILRQAHMASQKQKKIREASLKE